MQTALDTKTWLELTQSGYHVRTLAVFQRFRGLEIPWNDLGALIGSSDYVAKATRSRKVIKLSAGQFAAPVDVFVKRYNLRSLLRLLRRAGRKTRAGEEFDLGWKLMDCGIRTPRPVWLAEEAGTFSRYSMLATEALAGAESALQRWERCTEESERAQLLTALGQFTGRLHDLKFYHDDFKAGHLLVFPNCPSQAREFYVIDLLGGRFRALSRLARGKNLYQLLRSFTPRRRDLHFTPEHRGIFLEAYAGSRLDAEKWSRWVDRVGRLKGRRI